MDDNMKKMTIMRLGELNCFDEEQRIAILDMVKTGAISVDEAFSEVKRTENVFCVCVCKCVVKVCSSVLFGC